MLETIFERRSIRKYQDRPIEEEKIKTLLRAAMYAPSAADCRPWHYVVVHDREIMNEFMTFHAYSSMLKQAPLFIVVCGDKSLERAPGYYPGDCGAATENLLLAAHELGLGACWLGITPNAERMAATKKLLGLPEHIEAFCGIAIGYPAESREVPERYDEIRVHYDRW